MSQACLTDPLTHSLPIVSSWAVAWTKAHAENALEEFLATLKVPCFLPRILKRASYRSGVKTWHAPLFPGYVFFDQSAIEKQRVYDSRKVAGILAPQDAAQLQGELSQIALAISRDGALRETRFGRVGRKVFVARGPMKGLRGELVRLASKHRLILRISFLGKAAELAVDEAYLEPLYD